MLLTANCNGTMNGYKQWCKYNLLALVDYIQLIRIIGLESDNKKQCGTLLYIVDVWTVKYENIIEEYKQGATW